MVTEIDRTLGSYKNSCLSQICYPIYGPLFFLLEIEEEAWYVSLIKFHLVFWFVFQILIFRKPSLVSYYRGTGLQSVSKEFLLYLTLLVFSFLNYLK